MLQNIILLLATFLAVLTGLVILFGRAPIKMVALLPVAFLLSGCFQTFQGPFSLDTVKTDIAAIRDATVKACGFLPSVKMVETLITTAYPAGAVAFTVADAICSVAGNKSYRRGVVPKVQGVPLEGKWVKQR